MKLLFFDLETTGVKHWRNGIWQMAGCVDIDGEVVEKFNFKIRPNPKAEVDEEALKVGGITRTQLDGFPPMEEVYKNFTAILSKYVDKFNKKDKFHLVGYNNASFDNNFLRGFFAQNNDQYFGSWFWSDSLDTMVLACDRIKSVRSKIENFKLSTVCDFVGLKVDSKRLHDADYDIELTRDLYYWCQENNKYEKV